MRKPFASILAVASAVALAGCYESTTALIPGSAADFPFQTLRYQHDDWDSTTNSWMPKSQGTLRRENGHYVAQDDGDSSLTFMLKGIGGDLFVVQQENTTDYIYDLIRVDGSTVYEYYLLCGEEDRVYVKLGLLDRIEAGADNECVVSRFNELSQIFRAIANAERREPHRRYTIMR